MAELIGSSKVKSIAHGDANNLLETGLYYMMNCTNAPSTYTYLMVFNLEGSSDSFQLAFSVSDDRIYKRGIPNGRIGGWVEL